MGLGVEGYPAAAPTSLDMTAVNNKQNFACTNVSHKVFGDLNVAAGSECGGNPCKGAML